MGMEGIVTGVTVGALMIAINAAVGAMVSARKKEKQEAQQLSDNARRIEALENQAQETKELVKLTLGMCVILGDGMVQHGINGDFKKAFGEKKQDALKML
jgi:hypothetical protein